MLSEQEIIQEFEAAQAMRRGHFILSSGLHSDTYLQCARVLMNPKRAEKLCASLAEKIHAQLGENAIDLVVAPAMGGVVVGTIFCERENGMFALRRGFSIDTGARVLLVEDVVTTGKSSLETVTCIEAHGGKVVAEASLIDRSNGGHSLPFPLISLLTLDVQTYSPEALPQHLKDVEAVKPGSRWLQKTIAN